MTVKLGKRTHRESYLHTGPAIGKLSSSKRFKKQVRISKIGSISHHCAELETRINDENEKSLFRLINEVQQCDLRLTR